jgi:glycosyltransferase involved in cell wall biosynthesis
MYVAVLDASGFTPPYDRHYCTGLANHVDTVELITWSGFPSVKEATNFEVTRMFYSWYSSSRVLNNKFVKGLEHIKDMVRLVKYLQEVKPDILHIQWPTLPLIDKWAFMCLKKRFPMILTVHDTNPFHGSPSSNIMLYQFNDVITLFDGWMVHTQYSKRKLQTDYGIEPDDITVIPHGILEYTGNTDREKPDRFELLYFGNIKQYKGIDTLIKALGHLNAEQLNRLNLRIAGNPQEPVEPYNQLASSVGVSEAITWELGYIPDEELPTLFRNADAIVLPYQDIDQSGVLMTTVGYPTPIIASDIGGFSELLSHDENALLFPPKSPQKLKDCIVEVLENEETRCRLKNGIDEFADGIPSWSKIGKDAKTAYRQIE